MQLVEWISGHTQVFTRDMSGTLMYQTNTDLHMTLHKRSALTPLIYECCRFKMPIGVQEFMHFVHATHRSINTLCNNASGTDMVKAELLPVGTQPQVVH